MEKNNGRIRVSKTIKKNLILAGILAVVTTAGFAFTAVTGGFAKQEMKEDSFRIVTSFYPVHIAALNVADGLEGVEVMNMTENVSGCLHDYQLTAADMKKLEHADVFIINGAGMEVFLDSIQKTYPELSIIDTSEGITLLEAVEHDHSHDEDEESLYHVEEYIDEDEVLDGHVHEGEYAEEVEHNHSEYNGHIWMNPDNYVLQIENMVHGLAELDKGHSKSYEENGHLYIEKVEQVAKELEEVRKGHEKEPIVIFHDSYAYLADKLNFHIVHEVVIEEDTSMSAGEIAEIVEEIKYHEVSFLLAEKQFSDQIPTRIAKETDTTVIVVDSLVSGEVEKDAYLNGMRENIRILKEELN